MDAKNRFLCFSLLLLISGIILYSTCYSLPSYYDSGGSNFYGHYAAVVFWIGVCMFFTGLVFTTRILLMNRSTIFRGVTLRQHPPRFQNTVTLANTIQPASISVTINQMSSDLPQQHIVRELNDPALNNTSANKFSAPPSYDEIHTFSK